MRLRSIGLIITLALGILAAPLAAETQPAGKIWRIVVLKGANRVAPDCMVSRATDLFSGTTRRK